MSWAESSCPGKNTVSPPAATRLLNKMGAYISVETCHGYDIYPDCNITNSQNHTLTNFTGDNWPRNVSFGGVTKGNFQGNPDIAGVGILGVFVAVTSFALAAAILDIFWQALKIFGYKTTLTEAEKLARKQAGRRKGSFSEILEALVLACSDQQVFTGAAYALTLRYAQGCLVSAYHYNIVANMLLLTCATHLMSVTIVRNYWEYPWLAFIRIVCITGVFIVTGLLFTNQNAGQQLKFPTGVPPLDETESLLFLPAACFQGAANTATATFQESTKNASAFFRGTIGRSTPRNFIQGWNLYVLTLLFYGAAILAEAVRLVRRTKNKKGWRGDLNRRFGKYLRMGSIWRSIVSAVFLLYLVAGVAIGAASTVLAAHYIFQLRAWVDRSGWIQKQYNQNPENDATTFGQLVPIFLSALIVFSFAQLISDKVTTHGRRKHAGEEAPPRGDAIEFLDPSNYALASPPPPSPPTKPQATEYFNPEGVQTASVPPRVHLEHQQSWGSTISMGSVNVATPYSPWPMGEQQPSTAQVFQQSRPSVFAQTPHVNNSAGYVAVSTQADEEVPQAQAQSHHNSSHSLTLAQPSSPPQGWQSTGTSLTTPPMHSTAGHAAAAMQAEEATPPYQHHSGSSPDLIRLARPSVAPQGWQYTGVGPTTPQQQPSSRPSMGSLTPSRQSQQFGSHSSSPVPAHQQQQQQQWTSQPHLGSATPPS